MVTCYLRYVVDPYQVAAFEEYGRRWIALIQRYGGVHHGYFLPHEGTNNIAWALISFASLADYEAYRARIKADDKGGANFAFARRQRFILSEERTFLKKVEAA